jgi:hypothetical protein
MRPLSSTGAQPASLTLRGVSTFGSIRGRLMASRRSREVLLAVVASRAIVLAAGAVGATSRDRMAIWQLYDPQRISSSLGRVGDVLTATAVRWDAIHYLAIAHDGYLLKPDTVFFPLYPVIVHFVGDVIGSYPVAGIVISLVAFVIALLAVHRLTTIELGPRAAEATVYILAFAPLSFFFTADYTESLFLALSVGAVLAARRDRWAIAGLLAGLAAITRVPGILVTLPLAWMFIARHGIRDRRILYLLAGPLALLAFLGYLHHDGYGWLAPIDNQTGPQYAHRLAGPFSTVGAAVSAGVSGMAAIVRGTPIIRPELPFGLLSFSAESVELLLVLVVALVALVVTFRRLPAAYGVYSLAVIVVCVYSPTVNQPLQAFDRYTLTIFPLWMATASVLSRRRRLVPFVCLEAALLAFYSFVAAAWFFIA